MRLNPERIREIGRTACKRYKQRNLEKCRAKDRERAERNAEKRQKAWKKRMERDPKKYRENVAKSVAACREHRKRFEQLILGLGELES